MSTKTDKTDQADKDLGFIIRCMAAHAIDTAEGKDTPIRPDMIRLHYLDPEYEVIVKVEVKKKPDA